QRAMLRRDLPLSDTPERWLLISQIEHARISGELARAWGNTEVAAVIAPQGAADAQRRAIRDEWLAAVRHHDDGWAGPEADPAVDQVLGRPYSFLDMPREESLGVWRDSIHLTRRHG